MDLSDSAFISRVAAATLELLAVSAAAMRSASAIWAARKAPDRPTGWSGSPSPSVGEAVRGRSLGGVLVVGRSTAWASASWSGAGLEVLRVEVDDGEGTGAATAFVAVPATTAASAIDPAAPRIKGAQRTTHVFL